MCSSMCAFACVRMIRYGLAQVCSCLCSLDARALLLARGMSLQVCGRDGKHSPRGAAQVGECVGGGKGCGSAHAGCVAPWHSGSHDTGHTVLL